jgi:steroid delta-isomerase-like uncharacterized protein
MAVTDTTSTPPETTSPGELVRWAFGRLNAQDVDVLRQFWTPETYERFPDRECRGADEIVAYFEESFAAIGDFEIEVVNLVEQGEDVYVQWHLTGTHRGTFAGVEGTGKPLAIDGIDHFVVRDGRVVSNFVVFDQMQYAQQIGMFPTPGTPADRAVKGAFNLRTRALAKLREKRG